MGEDESRRRDGNDGDGGIMESESFWRAGEGLLDRDLREFRKVKRRPFRCLSVCSTLGSLALAFPSFIFLAKPPSREGVKRQRPTIDAAPGEECARYLPKFRG